MPATVPQAPASKAAVLGLAMSMAVDHGPDNIRVNRLPRGVCTPHGRAAHFGSGAADAGWRDPLPKVHGAVPDELTRRDPLALGTKLVLSCDALGATRPKRVVEALGVTKGAVAIGC